MSHVIFHVDDNSTARHVFSKLVMFQKILPGADLRNFFDIKSLFAELEKNPNDLPWIIFTDLVMPEGTGIDLMTYIRRHPVFHSIPIVLVTADPNPKWKLQAEQLGILDFMLKPIGVERLEQVIQRRKELPLDINDFNKFSEEFADNSLRSISNFDSTILPFNETKLKSLIRFMHTVKGEAATLYFHPLSVFAYTCEKFLKSLEGQESNSDQNVADIIKSCLSYLENQLRNIKAKKLMDVAPEELCARLNQESESTLGQEPKKPKKDEEIMIELSRDVSGADTPKQHKDVANQGLNQSIKQDLSDGLKERLGSLQTLLKRIVMETGHVSAISDELKSMYPDTKLIIDLEEKLRILSDSEMHLVTDLYSLLSRH